jgi:hypothetical protein
MIKNPGKCGQTVFYLVSFNSVRLNKDDIPKLEFQKLNQYYNIFIQWLIYIFYKRQLAALKNPTLNIKGA